MELLTKWNLSDACDNNILKFSKKICHNNVILLTLVKKGHQLLDQIVVPHISFKKAPIMTYKQKMYYLHYRLIFDVIKELLSNKDIQLTPSIVTPVIVTFYYIVIPVEYSKHFIIKIYPI
ncbi:hypothetical protein GLOIN_2v1784311 [Rhizophagus irregularis DAOM 181602=DAOM 197198]|nr:hypothetical protein GLOIN_2v1784311 [Rhizophagus irregularis DAOM 181602=DAOM 197198]